jgi:tetratricopeptide (TPR) repeat protein
MALLVAAGGASAAGTDLAAGDAAWALRAVGEIDGRAPGGPIAGAVAAYTRALGADPMDLEARWKLLRALHYEAKFSEIGQTHAEILWEEAIRVSDESVEHVAKVAGARLEKLAGVEQEALIVDRGLPGNPLARIYFWSGVIWSAWSQQAGIVSAIRKGVATRVRDYAQTALQLEPDYLGGGPYRLLGRMHALVPRIPFLTGWVDRSRAVPLLEQAYALAPWHPENRLLLALTLEELAPEREAEALALLWEVAQLRPRDSMRVEDLNLREQAREHLAKGS